MNPQRLGRSCVGSLVMSAFTGAIFLPSWSELFLVFVGFAVLIYVSLWSASS